MAISKKVDDEIRLKVLEALLKKNAIIPNMRQIKRQTGLHKTTIKSSLDFLTKEGLLSGYGPKLDFKKLGYRLEVMVMLQVDTSEKKLLQKFLEKVKEDPNIYRLSAIIGSGNWNMMASHIYTDIETYHLDSLKKYYESIPGIFRLIKDKQIFYVTDPYYKNESRTQSVIDIVKNSKGYR